MLVLVGIGKGKGDTCDVSDVRVFRLFRLFSFLYCGGMRAWILSGLFAVELVCMFDIHM